MKTYRGWIVQKHYYKVEVEAEDWLTAKDKIENMNVSELVQDGATEFDSYDIEEVAQ